LLLAGVCERESEAPFIGGGGRMCHGIFPLYSPKPTSFWRLGTLNQAAHPVTDQDMSVWTDWLKMGLSGSGKGATMP
jgi:hypothetical protein